MRTEEEYQKLLDIIDLVIGVDANSYGVAGTGIGEEEYLKISEIIPELKEFM